MLFLFGLVLITFGVVAAGGSLGEWRTRRRLLALPASTIAAAPGGRPVEVLIPVGTPGLDHGGSLYRTDGVVAVPVRELRKLNFPAADDPADTWQVTTTRGQGWIDRHSGQTLAWQDAGTAQRINEWAVLLHTGQGAWVWALVLGLVGLSIPLFWATGLILWWQMRSQRPRIAHNSAPAQADTLIFVASENGSTWGFAQALHEALVRALLCDVLAADLDASAAHGDRARDCPHQGRLSSAISADYRQDLALVDGDAEAGDGA